jgi:predicted nuclease of restriction endonuclease-like RecB superfamily
MLTRVVKDVVWVESTEGFKVGFFGFNAQDSYIVYSDAGREIRFETTYWHESKEDRQADRSKMTSREFIKYWKRAVTLIPVPDNLRWNNSDEAITIQDRQRILGNIRAALEFENEKPRFVRQP